jgi:hypothetical protein
MQERKDKLAQEERLRKERAKERREERRERSNQRNNQLMLAAILSAFNNNNQGRGLAMMPSIPERQSSDSTEEELSSIKSEDSTPAMEAKLKAGQKLSTKGQQKSTSTPKSTPKSSPQRKKTPTKSPDKSPGKKSPMKKPTPNKPLPTRAAAAAKKATGMKTRKK